MVYEVHVTLNRKYYSNIVVTALLSSDGNEYAFGRVPFSDVGTKAIQLKVCSHDFNPEYGTHIETWKLRTAKPKPTVQLSIQTRLQWSLSNCSIFRISIHETLVHR